MVRGLLIRQSFMALDLALAILAAVVLFMVTGKLLDNGRLSPVDATVDEASAAYEVPIWQVGERPAYDGIVTQGLFGDAGRTAQKDAPAAPPPEPTVDVAPSTLKLFGAGGASPEDPLGFAIIENAAARTPEERLQTYFIGQEVMPQLKLLEVYHRKVILFDETKNQKQELSMEGVGSGPSAATALAASGQPGAPAGAEFTPGMAVLSKNEAMAELSKYDYNQLMSTLNPQMHTDENGKINGITSDNINAIPLARRIGLQNGDVIQSVNGVNIDSEERLIEIFTRFQNSDSFRLDVNRGGRSQNVSFRLN
ncbi:MAG: hypothetical protein AMXMBFR84_02140 [Candidatus Hydrogenedentota bacterium]